MESFLLGISFGFSVLGRLASFWGMAAQGPAWIAELTGFLRDFQKLGCCAFPMSGPWLICHSTADASSWPTPVVERLPILTHFVDPLVRPALPRLHPLLDSKLDM